MTFVMMTLEEFMGESIDRSFKRGFHQTGFMRLRAERGTVSAIRRSVEGHADNGFDRLCDLGLMDWSLEAAVAKYPERFNSSTVERARACLSRAATTVTHPSHPPI